MNTSIRAAHVLALAHAGLPVLLPSQRLEEHGLLSVELSPDEARRVASATEAEESRRQTKRERKAAFRLKQRSPT